MRYCFVHVPKTGGRFLNKFFANRDDVDIVRGINPKGMTYAHPTCKELKSPKIDKMFVQDGNTDMNNPVELFDKSITRTFFNVSRNPYDWLESFYFYFGANALVPWARWREDEYKSFEHWMMEHDFHRPVLSKHGNLCFKKTHSVPSQSHWSRGTDFYLRLEHLKEDLEERFGDVSGYEDIGGTWFGQPIISSERPKVKWTTEMRQRANLEFWEDFERYKYPKL